MLGDRTCPFIEYLCWGKRCSWWDMEANACAVIGLATSVRRIEQSLQKLTPLPPETAPEKPAASSRKRQNAKDGVAAR
ncbi:MAG: hypothetical protein N2491_07690 [Negativicutes bacterium]|nr:hypothetical protein [Negativicutes bacterium]